MGKFYSVPQNAGSSEPFEPLASLYYKQNTDATVHPFDRCSLIMNKPSECKIYKKNNAA